MVTQSTETLALSFPLGLIAARPEILSFIPGFQAEIIVLKIAGEIVVGSVLPSSRE